jgi:hypothetical protein
MRLSFRQWWQLRGIEHGLRRSDPHLAAMLAIFAKLSAGETVLGREQVHRHRPGNWVRPVLAVLAATMRCLAAAVGWVPGRAAQLGASVRRLGRAVGSPLGPPLTAENDADPRRSLG